MKDSPRDGPSGEDLTSPGRRMENLLDQLHARTRLVRDAWQAGESASLKMLAGQLAALAEGTGNDAIVKSAAELEGVLLAEEAEASAICERIEALIQQCRKAAQE
jgi:hypothetical protein